MTKSRRALQEKDPAPPRFEALEPRQLLSGVTTAAALEPAYLAPAPTSDVWRADLNNDGAVNAADTATRPGAAINGTSSLRIGGRYASDPVPGNTSLNRVVVAGYGEAGGSVVLGSGATFTTGGTSGSSTININGTVEQGDLDLVLVNWGSTVSPYRTVNHTTDLLAAPLAYSGPSSKDHGSILLADTPPEGQATLRDAQGANQGYAIARGRGLAYDAGRRELSAVVGFEQPYTVLEQGRYLPLVYAGSGEFEVRVKWDNAWGDPFAQGVGAAITSSNQLALVAAGGYAGRFTVEVERLRDGSPDGVVVEKEVVVSPNRNQAPRPVALPTQIRGDADGVWRFQLPQRDDQGEPLRYDVSFGPTTAGTYRWDGEAYIDANNVLVIDQVTIEEMMRQRAAVQATRSAGQELPGAGFDGMHLGSMPFELILSSSDGWSVTTQKATLMFAPHVSPPPALGLTDQTGDRSRDTYAFNVPAYDAQGDAIDYDLSTSTGTATLDTFVNNSQHRVTITSPYVGIKPISVHVTMADGGLPVQESFVIWAARAGTPAPYIEVPDQVRDAAQGTIITVRLPPADRAGTPFTYEAVIAEPDAQGRLIASWDERVWGSSTVGGPATTATGVTRIGPDEKAGYDALFDSLTPIIEHGRVLVRPNRIGIVLAPDYVGDLAVMLRATHGQTTIYDAFKVTVNRASTPRPLDSLIGVTRDVHKPAERRGHFQMLPRTDDRGRAIRYTVRSSARDWVALGQDAAGQFGINVVPRVGFGGSFGITLVAEVGGERVVRRFNHHVAYPLGMRTDALSLATASSRDLLPPLRDVTRSMTDGPWSMTLPATSGGQAVAYRVDTTSGPWAGIETDAGGRPTLHIRPPAGFRGSFLVEVEAAAGGQLQQRVFEFSVPL